MKAIKESPRNTFPWWACYFTNSKESWYPPAEKKLNFQCVSATLSHRELSTFVEKETSKQLQLWSTINTKTVRQIRVDQKTTVTKSEIRKIT